MEGCKQFFAFPESSTHKNAIELSSSARGMNPKIMQNSRP